MKNLAYLLALAAALPLEAQQLHDRPEFSSSKDLQISQASVTYDATLDQMIFKIQVKGEAGKMIPEAWGQVDGAPVLGYVFPTTLNSVDVGFGETSGIVALALTSHPDFDDTPLWDENSNRNLNDDGVVWHSHWVVLVEDSRVPGGLSAKKLNLDNPDITVPPTHPGMPIYLDSPGHPVITRSHTIIAVVPAFRMMNQTEFNFDAISAYMQVNTSNPDLPMLGVYEVYSVLSGNLSLPYTVSIKH